MALAKMELVGTAVMAISLSRDTVYAAQMVKSMIIQSKHVSVLWEPSQQPMDVLIDAACFRTMIQIVILVYVRLVLDEFRVNASCVHLSKEWTVMVFVQVVVLIKN